MSETAAASAENHTNIFLTQRALAEAQDVGYVPEFVGFAFGESRIATSGLNIILRAQQEDPQSIRGTADKLSFTRLEELAGKVAPSGNVVSVYDLEPDKTVEVVVEEWDRLHTSQVVQRALWEALYPDKYRALREQEQNALSAGWVATTFTALTALFTSGFAFGAYNTVRAAVEIRQRRDATRVDLAKLVAIVPAPKKATATAPKATGQL